MVQRKTRGKTLRKGKKQPNKSVFFGYAHVRREEKSRSVNACKGTRESVRKKADGRGKKRTTTKRGGKTESPDSLEKY